MRQYKTFLRHILDKGKIKKDRTGTGTRSTFGYQMRYDLTEGFPLLTTKKVHLKSVIHELIWFISGDTNIKYLVDNGVRIWNEGPYEDYKQTIFYQGETLNEFVEKIKNDDNFAALHGNLGPVYGKQWRDFNGFDQLDWVINEIKTNPHSRRLIVNAGNPPQLKDMALPPCHMMFHFYVSPDGKKLSLNLYQRSADAFLGIPFNIASYALLLMMVAQITGLEAHEMVHTIGDAHIYLDHMKQVATQLEREPRPLPKMVINPEIKSIDDFRFEDFTLEEYNPHPIIRGKVSV